MERIIALLLVFAIFFVSCDKEEGSKTPPLINFKQGEYTKDGDYIPVGGKLTFGIAASGSGAPITNFRVQRIVNGVSTTELDKGLYITEGGLDFDVNSVKSGAQEELWRFMVMNANRDSAAITLTIFLGEGSAYGPIKHFPSIKVGMQNNTEYPQFLDLRTGTLYTSQTVAGNENAIDLLGFVYFTGGVMSPTLSCPQYSSVPGHYPMVTSWPVRRSTLYDYNSVDNNLVNLQQFEAAANDSLLVASYRPQNVSGLCKFCFTGKIVPFKTEEGKYGLIRVIHADEVPEGYMELEVKVQE